MPSGSDQDWYRFEAKASQTYVVEVFDVETGLVQTPGTSCTGNFRATDIGISLTVNDENSIEVIKQCTPTANDNIHNRVSFKASQDNIHYIRVASNAESSMDFGNYSIRVILQ